MLLRPRKKAKEKHLAFYMFIAPWLVGFFVLMLGPMLYSLYASFSDWDGIAAPVLKGIDNFRFMLTQDDLFWTSVGNTFYYALVSVPLNLSVALLLASLVNRRMFGNYVFRSIFYLPSIVSGVAVFLTWKSIFNPVTGVFNAALAYFGIEGPGWLTNSSWAMPSLILMQVTACGGTMLIFLAGLQDIPEDYYEAAKIDGATNFKAFWRITFPLLTPVIFFNLIMNIIHSLQVFTQPYVMTEGGPMRATWVYGIHLFSYAFRYYKFGYACALAWAMFLIIALISMLVLGSSKHWVHYAQDVDS